MIGYGNSMFLATHGILARAASGAAIDPDAQAFITAAAITDPTQQAAINTLVVDLKGYNIWTKMKALYPMVGGTSTSTSYNLKNPAQFQISWIGGVTWNSNGVTFNGVNGYGDTGYNLSANSTTSNVSGGVYLRTNVVNNAASFGVRISNAGLALYPKLSDTLTYWSVNDSILAGPSNIVSDTRGLFVLNKISLTEKRIYRNGTQIGTTTPSGNIAQNANVWLGAANNFGSYDTREQAFAFLGDTLTNTEVSNFYTAVQAFQTTLGRSIGTQTVSDADAQAFVTNAGIVDQVEANAINNLVIGMKADGTWNKMKAIYPMVGGSSSTMKYNLKNPLDTDAAFRLVFNGGWTFSSNGATPNGTNGWANTFFIPNISLTTSSAHISKYNRTNDLVGNKIDGVAWTSGDTFFFQQNYSAGANGIGNLASIISYTPSDTRGLITTTRTANNVVKAFRNTTQLGTTNTSVITGLPQVNVYLGARNDGGGTAQFYNSYQCAFASIGDGLTDTEVTNLNTRVTTFQTALNRNV